MATKISNFETIYLDQVGRIVESLSANKKVDSLEKFLEILQACDLQEVSIYWVPLYQSAIDSYNYLKSSDTTDLSELNIQVKQLLLKTKMTFEQQKQGFITKKLAPVKSKLNRFNSPEHRSRMDTELEEIENEISSLNLIADPSKRHVDKILLQNRLLCNRKEEAMQIELEEEYKQTEKVSIDIESIHDKEYNKAINYLTECSSYTEPCLNDKAYWVSYDKKERQILINDTFVLRSFRDDGDNAKLIEELIGSIGKEFTRSDIATLLECDISNLKSLHSFVDNFGFSGDLRKAFFGEITKNTICLRRKEITSAELKNLKISKSGLIKLN